jgi:hypothetical protein
MENNNIKNHSELILRIAELRIEKDIQEEKLQRSFKNIVSSLNLISLFKVATNENRPIELAKSGVNLALNLIIDLVMGKHRSIKGYLSAVMIEKFTTVLVNNNLLNIISGIGSLLHKKNENEKSNN